MVAPRVHPAGQGQALADVLGSEQSHLASLRSGRRATLTYGHLPQVGVGLDDDDAFGAEAARLGVLALDGAAGEIGVGLDAGLAQLGELAENGGAVGAVGDDEEEVDPLLLRLGRALEREQEPLDPGAEADAGRVRAAERLGQAVIAAAARERGLRAALRADELPGRPGVVVEAPHQRRHELVTDAGGVEVVTDLGEVLTAGVTERVADRRRLPEDLLRLRRLGGDVVERAERVAGGLLARRLVEPGRVLLEPGNEALEVGGPAGGVADRVQLEPVLADAEPTKERVEQVNHLRVDGGIVAADGLEVELPELAVAPLLRAAVAVHRPDREELLGLGFAVQTVLEVRAHDPGGRLGAEGQRTVGAIGERVHLLRDDVGSLARGACEELRVLDDGRVDPAVAVERAQALELRDHLPPAGLLGREDVVGASGRLEPRHAALPGMGCAPARRRASSAVRGPSRRPCRAGSARRACGSMRGASPSRRTGGRRGPPSPRRGRRRRTGSRLRSRRGGPVSGRERRPSETRSRRARESRRRQACARAARGGSAWRDRRRPGS